jgi:hypothetical protein
MCLFVVRLPSFLVMIDATFGDRHSRQDVAAEPHRISSSLTAAAWCHTPAHRINRRWLYSSRPTPHHRTVMATTLHQLLQRLAGAIQSQNGAARRRRRQRGSMADAAHQLTTMRLYVVMCVLIDVQAVVWLSSSYSAAVHRSCRILPTSDAPHHRTASARR